MLIRDSRVHSFNALVLLVSIPSETSIFPYCNILITYTRIHLKNMWIILTIFFKNRCNNNYHAKSIKYFTQEQVIVWLKLNFHEVFSVFNWFIIVYYFNLSFSSFSKFCVIFNASLFLFVESKTRCLIPLFFSICPCTSSRSK